MNETDVQNGLWLDDAGQSTVMCPNFTPVGWWEADLFSVTKAGFWIEHEIKLTLSDFKADAEKVRGKRCPSGWRIAGTENKHELLAAGDTRGPNRFYFVVPESLYEKAEFPDWAGIKTCGIYKGRTYIRQRRKAKLLHKIKASESLMEQVRSVFYWRFWSLRKKAWQVSGDTETWQD